jgi:hypothetical protein
MRAFFYLTLLLAFCFCGLSCSKEIYPSGLEGNLLGYQGSFKREQQRRARVARKAKRQSNRIESKAQRESINRQKRYEREREKFFKEHLKRQDSHVQARMKDNLRETKKNNRPVRSQCKKIVFWKKNRC